MFELSAGISIDVWNAGNRILGGQPDGAGKGISEGTNNPFHRSVGVP